MKGKKKSNIYNSYEDDIKNIADKEKDLISKYDSYDSDEKDYYYEDDDYYDEDADEIIEIDEDEFEDRKSYKAKKKQEKKAKKEQLRKAKREQKEIKEKEQEEKSIKYNEPSNKRDDIIVDDNLDDEEYEEYSLDEDEYADPEKKIKRTNRLVRILNIVFIILIVGMIMIATDVICVARYNVGPFFAIPTKTYKDGGTKVYYGLGYKVIKYNQIQGRKDKEIGFWNLKYNTDPTTIQALDLAIEFNDDETASYNKYYKKFVRVISTLEKVNTKNNTITLSYIDEGEKYSLDITCKMASKNSGISKLKVGDEVTIIGTVNKYDFKTTSKPGKLHINDCFAEQ